MVEIDINENILSYFFKHQNKLIYVPENKIEKFINLLSNIAPIHIKKCGRPLYWGCFLFKIKKIEESYLKLYVDIPIYAFLEEREVNTYWEYIDYNKEQNINFNVNFIKLNNNNNNKDSLQNSEIFSIIYNGIEKIINKLRKNHKEYKKWIEEILGNSENIPFILPSEIDIITLLCYSRIYEILPENIKIKFPNIIKWKEDKEDKGYPHVVFDLDSVLIISEGLRFYFKEDFIKKIGIEIKCPVLSGEVLDEEYVEYVYPSPWLKYISLKSNKLPIHFCIFTNSIEERALNILYKVAYKLMENLKAARFRQHIYKDTEENIIGKDRKDMRTFGIELERIFWLDDGDYYSLEKQRDRLIKCPILDQICDYFQSNDIEEEIINFKPDINVIIEFPKEKNIWELHRRSDYLAFIIGILVKYSNNIEKLNEIWKYWSELERKEKNLTDSQKKEWWNMRNIGVKWLLE